MVLCYYTVGKRSGLADTKKQQQFSLTYMNTYSPGTVHFQDRLEQGLNEELFQGLAPGSHFS